eukprot:774204-Amphidinium_carterae.1
MPGFQDSPLSLPVLMQVRTWHAVTSHRKGSVKALHCLGCSVGGFAIVINRLTASNHHHSGNGSLLRRTTDGQ